MLHDSVLRKFTVDIDIDVRLYVFVRVLRLRGKSVKLSC